MTGGVGQHLNRIIGRFSQGKPGPLVLAIGGIHGNEPAGVLALQEIFRMLNAEPTANPGFEFQGTLVGILGNKRAFKAGKRFLKEDLNRLWTPENVQRIWHERRENLADEDLEIAELLESIHSEILQEKPAELVMLDLHTTSAGGGIFSIPSNGEASLNLARQLFAPVILGLFEGVNGTLLHFLEGNHVEIGGFPKKTYGTAFEGGQHDDPESVSRIISAVVHGLRACGCVRATDVSHQHEVVLKNYSAGLPQVSRITHVHHLRPGDRFRMLPGFSNFEKIEEGQLLAEDVEGAIRSPSSGRILMPLYQKQGADGFFLIEPIASGQ